MAVSPSSSLRIPAPTHHPVVGACPRWLPFHVVSPQQAPAPGDGDDTNGPTGVLVPFSHAGDCPGEGRRRRRCARRWRSFSAAASVPSSKRSTSASAASSARSSTSRSRRRNHARSSRPWRPSSSTATTTAARPSSTWLP
ncbi:hypothetical protein ACQJBY_073030 [Aegilops geniculata]